MVDPKHIEERIIETYRSMITHGSAAVKAVMLVNGGSAVALLAFMGNVWKGDKLTNVPEIIGPMVLFVAGLFFGALASATAYFTQLALYREDLKIAKDTWRDKHVVWLWVSFITVFLGLICFVVGGIWAAVEFSHVAE